MVAGGLSHPHFFETKNLAGGGALVWPETEHSVAVYLC